MNRTKPSLCTTEKQIRQTESRKHAQISVVSDIYLIKMNSFNSSHANNFFFHCGHSKLKTIHILPWPAHIKLYTRLDDFLPKTFFVVSFTHQFLSISYKFYEIYIDPFFLSLYLSVFVFFYQWILFGGLFWCCLFKFMFRWYLKGDMCLSYNSTALSEGSLTQKHMW